MLQPDMDLMKKTRILLDSGVASDYLLHRYSPWDVVQLYSIKEKCINQFRAEGNKSETRLNCFIHNVLDVVQLYYISRRIST